MLIKLNEKTLDVTEKAFDVVYKSMGYKEVTQEELEADKLEELTVPKLKELAKVSDIEGYSTMNKDDLIEAIANLE